MFFSGSQYDFKVNKIKLIYVVFRYVGEKKYIAMHKIFLDSFMAGIRLCAREKTNKKGDTS
jgi:hypothetical protein